MNLVSRTLTRVVTLSLNHSKSVNLPTQKWIISQQIRLYAATVVGGRGKKLSAKASMKPPTVAAEKELARPKKIEYNPEISNWINLIGFVERPVQFGPCSEGKFWAETVISQRSGSKSSNFWIPIIFEGNLARIAAQHVKKEDQIHISGKLFIDSPPPNVNMAHAQSNVQVMVQSLNFVQAATSQAKTISPPENEEISTKKQPATSKKINSTDENDSESWKHLLDNPKEWFDYRGNKANGVVKPRHPDFKKKDGGLSLWLNKAPDWVLPKMEQFDFDVLVPKGQRKQLQREDSWKDLVQNPDKWWDNRLKKTNVKAPDFRHRETGEALWMTDSPTWVLSKLPSAKMNQERPLMSNTVSQLELDTVVPKENLKQLQGEEAWKNLVENPNKWWDNRLNKRNAKAPDFKHKGTGEALWMNSCPTLLLSKLPPSKNQESPVMA